MKIIDLFAGIGGIRMGFERIGAECVFSSEWDKHAQDMYEANLLRIFEAVISTFDQLAMNL